MWRQRQGDYLNRRGDPAWRQAASTATAPIGDPAKGYGDPRDTITATQSASGDNPCVDGQIGDPAKPR